MKTINLKKNPRQKIPDDFTGKLIFSDGDVHYYKNNLRHRDGGLPAIENISGSKEYHVEGKKHRIGGAAVEWTNGYKEYWINGKNVRKETHDLLVLILKLKDIKIP